jgi:Family of unknown function (DUF6252)
MEPEGFLHGVYRLLSCGRSLVAILTLACSDATGPGTNGALNVSARVDGSTWTPTNGGEVYAVLTPGGFFTLAANRRDALLQYVDGLRLAVIHVSGVGRYPLTGDAGQGSYVIIDRVTFRDTLFTSTPTNMGELEITGMDTLTHRIAGRFSFQAKEVGGDRSVKVDGGVFRVDYATASQ